MRDITAKRIEIDGYASVLPESPINGGRGETANDSYIIRSMGDERLPPFGQRGRSRSWLPGAWGDPF